MTQLLCYRCRKIKDSEEFYDCKSKGGRESREFKSGYCKLCQSKMVIDSRKKKRIEQRKEIIEAYGGKCAFCGFDDYRALVIDHVNDDGNEDRRNGLKHPNDFYRHIIINGFPDKYQVLCANCNTIKEFERKFS
jgi:hypothetical protein